MYCFVFVFSYVGLFFCCSFVVGFVEELGDGYFVVVENGI